MRRGVRGNSGFTLIEILVATAILVIVMSAIYGAFRAGNQSSIMIEENADLNQTARVLLGQISSELCSVDNISADKQTAAFKGDSSVENGGPENGDSLTFRTIAHKPCGDNTPLGDVCNVTYTEEFDDDGNPLGLYVKENWAPDLSVNNTDVSTNSDTGSASGSADNTDDLPETRLSDLVVGMNCTYLDPDSGDWVDQWVDKTTLPSAVRVELILKSKRAGAKPISVAMTTNLVPANTSTTSTIGGSSNGS